MMDIKSLKPCPFCGGECATGTIRYSKQHADEQGWNQDLFYSANCISCGANNKGLIGYQSEQKAIDAWNTRAMTVWKKITDDPDTFPPVSARFMLFNDGDIRVRVFHADYSIYRREGKYDGVFIGNYWRPLCDLDYPKDES